MDVYEQDTLKMGARDRLERAYLRDCKLVYAIRSYISNVGLIRTTAKPARGVKQTMWLDCRFEDATLLLSHQQEIVGTTFLRTIISAPKGLKQVRFSHGQFEECTFLYDGMEVSLEEFIRLINSSR